MKTYGKGSKLRKGVNLQAYRDNYDEIFRKEPANDVSQTPLGVKIETPWEPAVVDSDNVDRLTDLLSEQVIPEP